MDAGYGQLVTILLAAITIPAAALTFLLRPHRWAQFFRGGELAAWFALSIDGARRLILVGAGSSINVPPSTEIGPLTIPSAFWVAFNLCFLAIVSLVVWGRVEQYYRHKVLNKRAMKLSIEELRAMGVDVSDLEKRRTKRDMDSP